MYKSTARAEQFYERSGSEATKGSRKGFTLLDEGECPTAVLSEQDRFFNEQRAKRALLVKAHEEREDAKKAMHENFGKGDLYFAARMRHEKAKAEVQTLTLQLSEMKKARKNYLEEDFNYHFVEWCRENMPQGQFKAVMSIAAKKAEESAKAKGIVQ